jgi:hypothetical protein
MLGSWQSTSDYTIETWGKTKEGLHGYSHFKHKPADTLEQMYIKDSTFLAIPNGQTTTEFKLVAEKLNYLRFENPKHDFPKFIEYYAIADSLIATIGDNKNTMVFKFIKIK